MIKFSEMPYERPDLAALEAHGSLTLNHSKQFTNVASMPHFLMEILSNFLHLYIVLCSII